MLNGQALHGTILREGIKREIKLTPELWRRSLYLPCVQRQRKELIQYYMSFLPQDVILPIGDNQKALRSPICEAPKFVESVPRETPLLRENLLQKWTPARKRSSTRRYNLPKPENDLSDLTARLRRKPSTQIRRKICTKLTVGGSKLLDVLSARLKVIGGKVSPQLTLFLKIKHKNRVFSKAFNV